MTADNISVNPSEVPEPIHDSLELICEKVLSSLKSQFRDFKVLGKFYIKDEAAIQGYRLFVTYTCSHDKGNLEGEIDITLGIYRGEPKIHQA